MNLNKREIFLNFHNNIFLLKEKLKIYKYLFWGETDDFNNVVTFGGGFFKFFQDELQYSLILHISKILDKDLKTFSIKYLINKAIDNEKNKKLYLQKYKLLRKNYKNILNKRNKIIAHYDSNTIFGNNKILDVYMSEIEKCINEIDAFVAEFWKNEFPNELIVQKSHADDFMTKLLNRIAKSI